MKIIYYENSKTFFSDGDKENFFKVVGTTIKELEHQISKQPQRIVQAIYSNHKFLDNDKLNKAGLHVYRSLLANNVYRRRGFVSNSNVENLKYNGYFMIDNFLSDKQFHKLENNFQNIKGRFPNGKHITADVRSFFNNNRDYLELIKQSAQIKSFSQDTSNGFPRSEIWYHKHTKQDSQFKFHSDTFHPTIKCWLYLEDIEESQGPFEYVPQSNQYNIYRMIWDYENSNMKVGDELWTRRIEEGGKPGSFRVFEDSTIQEEDEELKRLGFSRKISCVGKKNTLLVANTFGYHKRGIGKVGSFRSTLTSQYRPVAFGVY